MEMNSGPLLKPGRRLVIAGVIAVATIGGVIALPLTAGAQHANPAAAKSTLQERKVGKYGEVLTNSAGRSLYVLSTESKTKLHCTSRLCVENWPPLLVAKNAKLTRGTGVKGKISHVTRGTKWQVTYNGWPVYRFAGDSGPGQSNGEKLVAFGGTWYLAHAAAVTNVGTPVKKTVSADPPSPTTTTTWGY
jgi:predicted lipoprotein with Yx(FWY)xxD motif